MICVSIGRGRHRMLMQEHADLAQQGVKLVELRLDYIRRSVDLTRLLQDRPTPVIATCRRPTDGGKWRGSERDRIMLLRTAIVDGADYVDLEHDIASEIPRYGPTKRIISYHNFRETPDDIAEIHAKITKLDPDIIKITTMANSPEDNFKVLRLIRSSSIPTIAFCMGDIGTPSRILCGQAGAPFTYATFSDERKMAPGQLSYQTMRDLYRYEQLNAETRVYGVIADPIGHSLSPLVHNRAFEDNNINAIYLPFRVPREHFQDFIAKAPELGIHGLSVTIPHKERAYEAATHRDKDVSGIKAANTLVFGDDKIAAYNTDCLAAMECIAKALNIDMKNHETPFEGKRVLIMGTGGVARAIAYGLVRRGADVTVSGRNVNRSEYLAKELKCNTIDWVAKHSIRPDVIINGTPVGMHPNVNESPIELAQLKSNHIVFDTVYNPEQTLLIKYARQKECKVITGTEMFVRQAAMQFKLFTGEKTSRRTMRERVRRAISPVRYETK